MEENLKQTDGKRNSSSGKGKIGKTFDVAVPKLNKRSEVSIGERENEWKGTKKHTEIKTLQKNKSIESCKNNSTQEKKNSSTEFLTLQSSSKESFRTPPCRITQGSYGEFEKPILRNDNVVNEKITVSSNKYKMSELPNFKSSHNAFHSPTARFSEKSLNRQEKNVNPEENAKSYFREGQKQQNPIKVDRLLKTDHVANRREQFLQAILRK